jgi:3-oxoacyl-[acyl-carrier protein] reductase
MRERALITGASRGIGAAIAHALAASGHAIILNYLHSHEAAEEVKAQIEAAGGEVHLAPFDVGDASAASAAIAELLEDPRPIGVLVNNAGITRDAVFPELRSQDWEAVIRTTLSGFYNVTHPLVMPMALRRRGRIINMTSVAGLVGNRGQVNYAAAKAGIIGATKSLAQELAKRRITVNAVAPGLIETGMTLKMPLERVTPLIPMRRLGLPSEVADLVAFLASDKAAYITGQVISINVGLV